MSAPSYIASSVISDAQEVSSAIILQRWHFCLLFLLQKKVGACTARVQYVKLFRLQSRSLIQG